MGRRRTLLIDEGVAQELRRLLVQPDKLDDACLSELARRYFLPVLTEYTLVTRELADAQHQVSELSRVIQRITREGDPERV